MRRGSAVRRAAGARRVSGRRRGTVPCAAAPGSATGTGSPRAALRTRTGLRCRCATAADSRPRRQARSPARRAPTGPLCRAPSRGLPHPARRQLRRLERVAFEAQSTRGGDHHYSRPGVVGCERGRLLGRVHRLPQHDLGAGHAVGLDRVGVSGAPSRPGPVEAHPGTDGGGGRSPPAGRPARRSARRRPVRPPAAGVPSGTSVRPSPGRPSPHGPPRLASHRSTPPAPQRRRPGHGERARVDRHGSCRVVRERAVHGRPGRTGHESRARLPLGGQGFSLGSRAPGPAGARSRPAIPSLRARRRARVVPR